MVMQDSEGIVHILDSKESLKDIATYIWQNESLKCFRVDPQESLKNINEVKFVELRKEKEPRLRGLSETDEYCNEPEIYP